MGTSLSRLVPELQPFARNLIELARRANVGGRITSTFRTFAEQSKLYEYYTKGYSPYPAAPPGTSAHEFGMAFDYWVPDAANQSDLGQVWESWGGVWGGRFSPKDVVHFEYPGFKATATARGCSPVVSKMASAVDFVLGLAPGLGEVELLATLVGLGFPRSKVLAFLKNPVSSSVCGTGI